MAALFFPAHIAIIMAEGVYEVLDYQSTLEIKDPKGVRATLRKVKKSAIYKTRSLTFRIMAGEMGIYCLTTQPAKGSRLIAIVTVLKPTFFFL